jgi:DNA-binding response OmpR family regulator
MPANQSILIVEDDAVLREALAENLASEHGFSVSTAATLNEADGTINAGDARIDAVILDVGMPDGDGRDYCAMLRRQGHKMPVIMLTGSRTEADVVRGLESGANDYIRKPFRANELLARIRAQLREFDNSEEAIFSIGPYQFQPAKRLLHDPIKNRRVRLTETEAEILKHLLRSGGRAVDRDMLLRETLGGDTPATSHSVVTHIYRLRKKLEPNARRSTLLVTERGGYRLNLSSGAAEAV